MSPTMPPLWLDYRQAPPARQLPGILLLLASLLLAGTLFAVSSHVASETALTERQVGKLRQAAERRRLFASAVPDNATTSSTASQPSSPAASRWESLFTSLETAADDTVTLLSLTPGARQIVITGEAKGLPAALDYAQRLQGSSALNNAYLSKYELVREHPRQPVLFTLLAEWRETAP